MVGLQTLDLAIGVRVPASQPNKIKHLRAGKVGQAFPFFLYLGNFVLPEKLALRT